MQNVQRNEGRETGVPVDTADARAAWDGVFRREIAVELRVLDEDTRTVEVIASTEALDSHGDIIRQFWDLTRYDANPVVLWNHNMFESSRWSMGGSVRPEDLMPIGYSSKTEVKSKKLHAKLVLGSAEYSEMAQKVYLGCKEKVIRAVSVGFRPGSITAVKDKAGNTKYYEIGSAEFPNELLEISFVPIGSNAQAVAKSIAFEHEHLSRMAAGNEDAGDGEQETSNMAMTAEEKAAYEKTLADNKTLTDRADKAEADLKAEKALAEKLAADLKAASERATAAESGVAKAALDARQGKKFAPAERTDLDQLAKDIGLERTLKLIDARPDVALTRGVTVNGNAPAGTDQPAPEPLKGDADDVSDIHKELGEAAA